MRADQVITIEYKDGSFYCQHADGTQMYTEPRGRSIRIEKQGFAPVTHNRCAIPAEDDEDLFDVDKLRSLDGVVVNVQLPDGCQISSLKFYKSYEERDRVVVKHLYQRDDYAAFVLDSEGDFRVVSKCARAAINENDEQTRLGNDVEFRKEIFMPADQMTPAVYYGSIQADADCSWVQARDSDKPYLYRLYCDGRLEKQNYARFEKNDDWAPASTVAPVENSPEIELINNTRNPFAKAFIFPKMFIVSPNGQGVELLSQDQLDGFVKNDSRRGDTLTTARVEQVDQAQMNSIQVINKVTTIQEAELNN